MVFDPTTSKDCEVCRPFVFQRSRKHQELFWRNRLEHRNTQEPREPDDPVQHSGAFTLAGTSLKPWAKQASSMMFFINPAKMNEDDISNDEDHITLFGTDSQKQCMCITNQTAHFLMDHSNNV
jgi:hypothetical protein